MNIKFNEEMAGTYRGLAAGFPGGDFSFRINVDCVDVTDPRVVSGKITGDAFMAGVVKSAPLEGTIVISPLWRRTIEYKFTFTVNGKPYKFEGQKDVKPWAPVKSMTTLPGKIYDETGMLVGEALTTFNVKRDMVSFLRSYKFA